MNDKLKAALDAAKAELVKSQTLRAEGKTEEATAAFTKAQEYRAEAETITKELEESKRLDDIAKSYSPVRPIIPGTGEGAVPQVADGVKSTTTATPQAEADEDQLIDSAKRAAYTKRFGDDAEGGSRAIKAILTDLHGTDYQTQFWAQKGAFNRYVRGGNDAIDAQDRKMLRGVILTPASIKMALDQGVDDLKIIKSMMVEASDTLGGYLVPTDFQMKMIEQLAQLTTIRGRASQMNTSRDRVEMPEATGGNGVYTSPVRVTWVDETPTVGQLTGQYLTFGLRGINVHTAMAEAPLSRNFLEDVAFDIEGYLATKLAESVALDEDNQFLIGNGVGKPRGILPGSANAMSITEVNSLGTSTLTWNGLIALTYGVPAQYRQEGVFLANRATYQAIAQMQDSTSGNYLWQAYQYDGGEAGRTKTLLGYPIVESEVMPDIAANAFPILFGDLRAYQIVDRLGMTVERFIGANEARQNIVYFVMRRRVGGELVETWKLCVQKVHT